MLYQSTAEPGHPGFNTHLKLVELNSIQQPVLVYVANLEDALQSLETLWFQDLTMISATLPYQTTLENKKRTCSRESYNGAVGCNTAFWAK